MQNYIKDPADHNHLLIDDKVAHVVREIFDLAFIIREDGFLRGNARTLIFRSIVL